MRKPFVREADNYTLYGALFGCMFPLVAMGIRIVTCGRPCSIDVILSIQASDPLLWIIDTAPLFLGLFARLGGIRQDKVNFYVRNLEKLVDERTAALNAALHEIRDIMENVPIGLLTVNRDCSINKGCSAFANSLLECGDARDPRYFPDVFGVPAEVQTQFRDWVKLLLDGRGLSWRDMKDLVPVTELLAAREGAERCLAVAYSPVRDEAGAVVRVMVMMHDVTEERLLRKEVADEKRRHEDDIEQIAEIIRLDPGTFEQFVYESRRIVAEAGQQLHALGAGDGGKESVNELFRKLHTLKGNAGSFRFTQLSELAHAMEDRIALVREAPSSLDAAGIGRMEEELAAIGQKLDSIVELAKNVTGGRDLGATRSSDREVFLRVKLDKVLDLASRIEELEQAALGCDHRVRSAAASVSEAASRLRTTPAARLFDRFPKMVKDLSAALGKEVDCVLAGSDTEVDMDLLDKVGNALVHVVRNAVDHGMETALERRESGKPSRGRIDVRLEKNDGRLTFAVVDDGRGLDRDRIAAKAVEKGLIEGGRAATLPDGDIYRLIMAPGFSTAERVTDISGRGVGMDVVSQTAKELNGEVVVESRPGRGTTITVSVPARAS